MFQRLESNTQGGIPNSRQEEIYGEVESVLTNDVHDDSS